MASWKAQLDIAGIRPIERLDKRCVVALVDARCVANRPIRRLPHPHAKGGPRACGFL